MKDILTHLLTGQDGKTHDLGRWSWLITTLSVIGGAAWNALHAGAVDLMQLAQAVGIVVAAHGAAIFAKKDTEPKPGETDLPVVPKE